MTVDEPLWEVVMKLSRVWESRTKTPNFELTWKQYDSVADGGEEIETSSMLGRRK